LHIYYGTVKADFQHQKEIPADDREVFVIVLLLWFFNSPTRFVLALWLPFL